MTRRALILVCFSRFGAFAPTRPGPRRCQGRSVQQDVAVPLFPVRHAAFVPPGFRSAPVGRSPRQGHAADAAPAQAPASAPVGRAGHAAQPLRGRLLLSRQAEGRGDDLARGTSGPSIAGRSCSASMPVVTTAQSSTTRGSGCRLASPSCSRLAARPVVARPPGPRCRALLRRLLRAVQHKDLRAGRVAGLSAAALPARAHGVARLTPRDAGELRIVFPDLGAGRRPAHPDWRAHRRHPRARSRSWTSAMRR